MAGFVLTGACRFYDADAHRCRVHLAHGEAALPSSCAHFPRRALIDDRGVFITLSHFCPTAAAGLVRPTGPLAIVEAPTAFPQDREYEGLDARGAWPPLVKPDLLFDLSGFTVWEHFVVATLGQRDGTPRDALAHIAHAAALVPGDATIRSNHAHILRALGRAAEARAEIEEALRIDARLPAGL